MIFEDSYLPHITYVGSQLTNCYEHPSTYEASSFGTNTNLGYDDWLTLCRANAKHFRGRWVETFKRAFGGNLALLAKTCVAHFEHLTKENAHCIFHDDPFYPLRLRDIRDPPFALNVLGDPVALTHQAMTAVVGSRRATPYALQQSFALAQFLQMSNVCTVSGGAFGCDIAAHHGVLAASVKPCAAVVVMAGGLHCFYPKGNAFVLSEIVRHGGAVVSERLWTTQARAFDFPIRNRIIAGICETVLIMQAGLKSGAMLTANLALDFGRDVYVLVHPTGGEAFEGNQKLLLDGALGFDGVDNYKHKNFMVIRSVDF